VDVNVRAVGLENETGSHVTGTDDNDGRQTMTTSTYDEDLDKAMLMSLPVDALHDCGKLLTDWV